MIALILSVTVIYLFMSIHFGQHLFLNVLYK